MKSHPALLAALALVLGLPLLGYLWPLPEPQQPPADDQAWNWPSDAGEPAPTPAPPRLAGFWPGQRPASTESAAANEAAAAGAPRAWSLIGVIRQGRQLSALVQDPQGDILTLRPGDALDAQRRVERIEPTRLHWRSATADTGHLPLYPETEAAPSTTP